MAVSGFLGAIKRARENKKNKNADLNLKPANPATQPLARRPQPAGYPTTEVPQFQANPSPPSSPIAGARNYILPRSKAKKYAGPLIDLPPLSSSPTKSNSTNSTNSTPIKKAMGGILMYPAGTGLYITLNPKTNQITIPESLQVKNANGAYDEKATDDKFKAEIISLKQYASQESTVKAANSPPAHRNIREENGSFIYLYKDLYGKKHEIKYNPQNNNLHIPHELMRHLENGDYDKEGTQKIFQEQIKELKAYAEKNAPKSEIKTGAESAESVLEPKITSDGDLHKLALDDNNLKLVYNMKTGQFSIENGYDMSDEMIRKCSPHEVDALYQHVFSFAFNPQEDLTDEEKNRLKTLKEELSQQLPVQKEPKQKKEVTVKFAEQNDTQTLNQEFDFEPSSQGKIKLKPSDFSVSKEAMKIEDGNNWKEPPRIKK
jgi:hypothetical protein